jgi:hypothetical protein
MELTRDRLKLHFKGAEIYIRQEEDIICEIVRGTKGKTIILKDIGELENIKFDFELTEEISIDYYIDKNIVLDGDSCCICYSFVHSLSNCLLTCNHSVCIVCFSKISRCPLCRSFT